MREVIDEHQGAMRRAHAAHLAVHVLPRGDERGAARRHRGDRHLAVGERRGERGRGRHRAAARVADRQRRRLGELGSDRIFENIGVVQEGMQTIAVPHSGVDRPGARRSTVTRGEIRFETSDLQLRPQRRGAGARPPDSHDPARRARRPGRPLGRGQVDARQPAAALLRAGGGPHPRSTARTSRT